MTNCSISWLIWGKIERLRGRLMVGQQTLDLFILVRIQAPQPVRIGRRSGGSAFRAFTLRNVGRLRGKRVRSAFFETCGQPPEKEGRKNAKIGFLKRGPAHYRSLKELLGDKI